MKKEQNLFLIPSGLKKILSVLALFFFLLLSCERRIRPVSQTEINTPPSILSVRIQPDKPCQKDELALSIQSTDPDRDPITYTYQWFKNGQEILGEQKAFLKRGLFKKHDWIQARVTPSDGKEEGKAVLSPEVQILNAAPEIESVRIESRNPGTHESLIAVVKASDPDGDFIYFTFQWERNGTLFPDEKEAVLEGGKFKKGDLIAVTIIADDRESRSLPKKSDPVTILNRPPIITSSPPTHVEGTTYSYQVAVHNPDGGPISFQLKSGPKGMTIHKETGLILWEVPKNDRGPHAVEIEALAPEGSKSFQRYTFTVDSR